MDQARYTELSVWIIKLGVVMSYSRPRHPQTNGKEERFHRTLKYELINNHYFRDLDHVQKSFNHWRDIYNNERPHQALAMQVPSDRYQPSYRSYQELLTNLEYPYAKDYQLHKVDCRGRVHLSNRKIFVGVPFAKEMIGIRQTKCDGLIEIYFCHQKLGGIDLSLLPKNTITNLYSKRCIAL